MVAVTFSLLASHDMWYRFPVLRPPPTHPAVTTVADDIHAAGELLSAFCDVSLAWPGGRLAAAATVAASTAAA